MIELFCYLWSEYPTKWMAGKHGLSSVTLTATWQLCWGYSANNRVLQSYFSMKSAHAFERLQAPPWTTSAPRVLKSKSPQRMALHLCVWDFCWPRIQDKHACYQRLIWAKAESGKDKVKHSHQLMVHVLWCSLKAWCFKVILASLPLFAPMIMANCWWYFMFTSISRPTDSTWWVPNMVFITWHTSQLYINGHVYTVESVLTLSEELVLFFSDHICAPRLRVIMFCVCETYLIVYGSKPAAWPPPSTPAALVWTAPPPICSTEQRGGSVSPRPVRATRQLNGTFVGIILPSLITKYPWQWGFTPTSPFIQSSSFHSHLNNTIAWIKKNK